MTVEKPAESTPLEKIVETKQEENQENNWTNLLEK